MSSKQWKIPLELFNPVYDNYIVSKTRYEIYYGGRGSGKSRFIAQKLILRAHLNKYFMCIYSRKNHVHIRDSQFSLLKNVIKDFGLTSYFKVYEGTMKIEHLNGNAFIAKGLDDPETVKSTDEPSHLWCEEVTQFNLEDFLTLDKSLRTKKSEIQAIVSFNPVQDSHWVRQHFFHPDDSHAANPNFGTDLAIIRTTYQDNHFIDREAYYKTLLIGAAGNPNRIRVDVDGDWGLPENKNPWLHSFEEKKHVSNMATFKPGFPIYLAFDFNRDPVTASVWQMSPQITHAGAFIHCVDEFGGQIQLKDLCIQIKAAYPASIMYVTGDSSGNKGDVTYNSKHDTAYSLISSYLQLAPAQMHQNKSNLDHENSRFLCNALFYNFTGLKINSKCKNLIADCIIARVDEKDNKPNHLMKDRDVYKMDYFDGMRYFFQRYLWEFAKIRYMNNK